MPQTTEGRLVAEMYDGLLGRTEVGAGAKVMMVYTLVEHHMADTTLRQQIRDTLEGLSPDSDRFMAMTLQAYKNAWAADPTQTARTLAEWFHTILAKGRI